MVSPDKEFLGKEEIASVYYHNFFNYPLNANEIIKWSARISGPSMSSITSVLSKNGYFFVKGREGLIYKRALRERISDRKIKIAKKIASILAQIPTVLGVFITGALAMKNAEEESDIDLMIITKANTLWISRLISYLVIWLLGFKIRKPGNTSQKDKLCINIWLDEAVLSWSKNDRNFYSAHEIAQIVPIINKNKIYQRFLQKNKWILNYWPRAVKILSAKDIKLKVQKPEHFISLLNTLTFKMQYFYMKSKITREVVALHKAIFHPKDWGKEVLDKLKLCL